MRGPCILVWLACVVGGCNGETTIGTAGGKIVSSDGQAVLEVPAGALSSDAHITIAIVTPPSGAVGMIAYDIGPTGLVFNKQASLSIAYATGDLSGLEEGWLRLGVLTGGAWQPVASSSVDLQLHKVVANLDHLSTYGVIPVKTCATVSGCQPTFVPVAAGSFQMGSPTGEPCREATTETQHQVTLTHAFEIGETEVTQEQFKALLGYNPSSFRGCGPDCPVEYVTWHEAAAYCNALSARLELTACYACTGSQASVACSEASGGASITACPGYRLPTEAEWEYAYRAGTQTGFYDGSEASGQCPGCDPKVDSLGWSSCNSDNKTHPVKQKAPNAWKLYDMAGNVWEWTHDSFVANLGSEPVTDPVGPAALPERAIRGGFWGNCACLLRGAARLSSPPAVHGNDHGFRCVRSK